MSNSTEILQTVKSGYAAVAQYEEGRSEAQRGNAKAIAKAFGYSEQDLEGVPAEANMGLSCGNPVAMASVRPGEVVLDLGSGGGFDVFQVSKKVGAEGRAIGVDMTEEMVDKARRLAKERGFSNTEFHLCQIGDMHPVADNSVDCVISNCVLNLLPDKNAGFREIFRVLKPGGRIAISDVCLKQAADKLPPSLKTALALVGCVAGAISEEDFTKGLAEAGFQHVVVQDGGADLNTFWQSDISDANASTFSCCGTAPTESVPSSGGCCAPKPKAKQSGCCAPKQAEPEQSSCCKPASDSTTASAEKPVDNEDRVNLNDYIFSGKIYAIKPASQ